MKNRQDIENKIKMLNGFIDSYKKEVEIYSQHNEFGEVVSYSEKIVKMQDKVKLLEWVLEK